jgi:hypothetical protein
MFRPGLKLSLARSESNFGFSDFPSELKVKVPKTGLTGVPVRSSRIPTLVPHAA